MTEFYGKLAETLELDEVKEADVLTAFPEWDSLAALSVIAMIGSRYGVNLGASDLKNASTAGALYRMVEDRRPH